MKTIAVLTDFSKRSEHAIIYAARIAQSIEADILLYNAFKVPDFPSSAVREGWPDEDYSYVKSEKEHMLRNLAQKFKTQFKKMGLDGTYMPNIRYHCEEGAVANNIADLESSKNIVLIVLGTHGVDDKSAFLMGNNCMQIIEAATVPILVVPENASLHRIEKFVFATDNSIGDVDYINSLSTLAKHFSAEIIVANVYDEQHSNSSGQISPVDFFKTMLDSVKYKNLSYRQVINNSVHSGLEWLIENVLFDVLVMVHRKHESFNSFLKPSITQNIASNIYVPLLVFPFPAESLPEY